MKVRDYKGKPEFIGDSFSTARRYTDPDRIINY